MTIAKPLSNKKILVTRGVEQGQEFAKKISEAGGEPILIPLITFELPKNTNSIEHVVNNLHMYEWLVFTSKNGVEYFFQCLQKFHVSKQHVQHLKIAVVGTKTEEIVKNNGFTVEVIPSKFDLEGLLEALKSKLKLSDRVLLARGNLARSKLPEELKNSGVTVTDLIVYETVLNEVSKRKLLDLLPKQELDAITFTSPSTVLNFITLLEGSKWREWIGECAIACIGPVTKKTADDAGLHTHVCPETYTVDAMLKSLTTYFQQLEQKVTRGGF